jgi:hypothetical protein
MQTDPQKKILSPEEKMNAFLGKEKVLTPEEKMNAFISTEPEVTTDVLNVSSVVDPTLQYDSSADPNKPKLSKAPSSWAFFILFSTSASKPGIIKITSECFNFLPSTVFLSYQFY